ncbi:hypothetical protein HPB47_010352 [Ixodes persulcatus]|uniref:Uncharacterized protein n=1 Tax=Ixodes persulcatus TaxID=34615 RepID=A0AC60NZL3_IXOPE|nr:hypothetical protein HPB47_010352 [Ixodes persulcatus]
MMQQEESAKCAEEPLGLNDSSEPEGYRLIDVSCIKVLMSALLCPECVGSSLDLTESGKGIHLEFVVLCATCGEVARALHSVNIGDTRQNELAARIGLSARDSGLSHVSAEQRDEMQHRGRGSCCASRKANCKDGQAIASIFRAAAAAKCLEDRLTKYPAAASLVGFLPVAPLIPTPFHSEVYEYIND